MRITKATRIEPKIDHAAAVELSVGDYDDVTTDWYQTEINSLHDELDEAGIEYLEYTLMRKAIGADNGLLVALAIWGTSQALSVLKAWLPAKEGRKVRIKFKDGTEIEAATISELEEIYEKFLSHQPEKIGDGNS